MPVASIITAAMEKVCFFRSVRTSRYSSSDLLADCFEYDHDVGVLVGEYMLDGSAQACLVSNRRNGTTFTTRVSEDYWLWTL